MSGRPRVDYFLDVAGEGRYRVVAENGETLCQSEGYTDGLYGAREGYRALWRAMHRLNPNSGPVVEDGS